MYVIIQVEKSTSSYKIFREMSTFHFPWKSIFMEELGPKSFCKIKFDFDTMQTNKKRPNQMLDCIFLQLIFVIA